MTGYAQQAGAAVKQLTVRVLPDGRLNRRDAATYLGLAPKTLAMWALEGRGPEPRKVGSRIYYYREDLDRFICGAAGDAQYRR